MKKKKPTPDPLAKLSAPNLRRMVKRRDAEIARLIKRLDESNAAYNRRADDLARMNRLAMDMKAGRDHYTAMCARLSVRLERLETTGEPLPDDDPNDHPHPCGALEGERYVLTRLDDAQRVVCHVAVIEPGHWYRIVREGGEDTRTAIIPDNTPAEVQVPPFGAGMPGATMGADAARPPAWWLPTWLRLNPTVYAPAVADAVDGRAVVVGNNPASITRYNPAIWAPDQASWVWFPPEYPGQEREWIYELPPATWRAA